MGAVIRLAASKRVIIQLGAYRKQLMVLSQNAPAAPFASTCWALQISANDSSIVAREKVSETPEQKEIKRDREDGGTVNDG